MLTIYAVCASGIGTSLFSRKLIADAVSGLGYDPGDVKIGCIGAQEAIGTITDVFVTGSTIAKNIPDRPGVEKVIVVNMINDITGMKNALDPILKKAETAGKIKRHAT